MRRLADASNAAALRYLHAVDGQDRHIADARRPLLIVVSGLPGSGKTTLARAVGAQLTMPVVERDRFAEICFDALGACSPAVAELGSVSYELLFHVVREFMASRQPVLVESNFSRTRHADQLYALLDGSTYRLAEINCRAPGDVLLERFAERARNGTRHARHDDRNRIDEFRAFFADPVRHEDAVVFPDRALVVDTTREVSMDDVLRHLSPGDTDASVSRGSQGGRG
jgi:predicted kinase